MDERRIDHVSLEPGYHEFLAVLRDSNEAEIDSVSLGDLISDYSEKIYYDGNLDGSDYDEDTVRQDAEDLISAVDEQRENEGQFTLKETLNEEQMDSLIDQIADEYKDIWQAFDEVQNRGERD